MGSLVLMQPYFVPYIGYFGLIANSDRFVTFDTAQFIKGGWIQRNRMLKPGGGWQYIRVPLRKAPHHAAIGAVEVAEDGRWRRKMRNQLQHYRRAPHFADTLALLDRCVDLQGVDIATFNLHSLRVIAEYIGLTTPIEALSDLDLDLSECAGPGDWGRVVCRESGASRYLNAVGGRDLFDPTAFAQDNVELTFLQARPQDYTQLGQPHEPWLSILDVLMFHPPERVREMCFEVDITDASGAPWMGPTHS